MDPSPAGSTVMAAPKSSTAQGLPRAQQCSQEPGAGPGLRPELTKRTGSNRFRQQCYHRQGDTATSGQLSQAAPWGLAGR